MSVYGHSSFTFRDRCVGQADGASSAKLGKSVLVAAELMGSFPLLLVIIIP